MIDTLRLVTCLYGANGRLPFEGGVALALLELVVASRRARGHDVPGFDWLDGLDAPLPDIRLDVVAGSSAGGVIGAVLTKQLVDSSDPEAGIADALAAIVDEMDFERMTPADDCPRSLLDKTFLSRDRLGELLRDRSPGPDAPVLEPDAELWVSLTQVTGAAEYVRLGGEWFEDVRYVDTRRFDRIDFARRAGAIADTIDATSANPWLFGPTDLVDLDSPAGYVAWLRERAGADDLIPTLPDGLEETIGPPPRVPCYDGGVLDNRPLEAAINAAMRRGLATRPNERLVVVVIDPLPARVESRQLDLLKTAADGRRAPHLSDQMAALGRAGEIVLHERIAEDLARLQAWTATVDLTPLIALDRLGAGPGGLEVALASAADRLLFNGEAEKLLDGRPPEERRAVLGALARTLARRPHGDRLRDGLLRAGGRVRRLLRQKLLWEEPGARDHPGAARMRRVIDRLLGAEMDKMHALAVEAEAAAAEEPTEAEIRRLLVEAFTGRPLPPPPHDVRARRVNPPPGGLASDYLEPFAGFFERDFRLHDVVVGLVEGRRAVADLLPPAAAAAWRRHFRLDDDAAARAWLADAPGRTIPWRAWLDGWRRVVAARGPGDDPETRAAREQARLRPRLGETLARMAVRFWAMAATAPARGASPLIYHLGRDTLAPITRFLVPTLLRLESRLPAVGELGTLTYAALLALPPVLLVAGVLFAGRWLGLSWPDTVIAACLTVLFTMTPIWLLALWARVLARRRLADCRPPIPAPGPLSKKNQ